jgi:peptidoglycan/LPS O-acetylase OafA/YrhL
MRRCAELDAVRGLASLFICLFHILGHDSILRAGWSMVDLFFVLSGYLINSILIMNAGQPGFLKNFYARRSIRIWPIYYLTLGVLILAAPFMPWLISLRGIPYYLTYTQFVPRYWGGEMPPFTVLFQHTWTLAIEEQFYTFWPVLILLVGTKRLAQVATAALGISVACRLAGMDHWLLVARGDGLALGAILAVLLRDPQAVDRARSLLRAAFGSACAVAIAYLVGYAAIYRPDLLHHDGPIGLSILFFNVGYFGLIGWIALDCGRPYLRPLRAGWLVSLGKISYGLYLYHILVIWFVNGIAIRSPLRTSPLIFAVQLGLSIAVAALSWRYIERPFLALKERFAYRVAPVVPADALIES